MSTHTDSRPLVDFILAELLDTINDVRDAGDTARLFDLVFRDSDTITSETLTKQLEKPIEEFQQDRPDITRICEIAKTTLSDLNLEIRRQDSIVTVAMKRQGSEIDTVQQFSTIPLLWQASRISSEELFNTGNGVRSLPFIIRSAPEPEQGNGEGALSDFYTKVLEAICIVSQDMYRHCRETEELGSFAFRANFFIIALVLVALVVAGLALLAIGSVTNSDTLKTIGLALISLGLILMILPGKSGESERARNTRKQSD